MKRLHCLLLICLFLSSAGTALAFDVPSWTSDQTHWIAPLAGTYRITASGIIHGPGEGDAGGFANYPGVGWTNIAEMDGAALGQGELLINYQRVVWGAFRSDHIYSVDRYVAAGEALGFSYADSYPFVDPRFGQVMDWYENNTGSLQVDIATVPEPSSVLVLLCGIAGLGSVVSKSRRACCAEAWKREGFDR